MTKFPLQFLKTSANRPLAVVQANAAMEVKTSYSPFFKLVRKKCSGRIRTAPYRTDGAHCAAYAQRQAAQPKPGEDAWSLLRELCETHKALDIDGQAQATTAFITAEEGIAWRSIENRQFVDVE